MNALEEFFAWCEKHAAALPIIAGARRELTELRAAVRDFDHPRRQRAAMRRLRELAEAFEEAAVRVRRH